MSFKAKKEKDITRIVFEKSEQWRYFFFIIFIGVQGLAVWRLSLAYPALTSLFEISLILSPVFILLTLISVLVVKSLKLHKQNFSIEYRIFSVLLYKRSIVWTALRKVSVEENLLKSYDILFTTESQKIYLGESLDEETSDTLLKEIQLFHHYYS